MRPVSDRSLAACALLMAAFWAALALWAVYPVLPYSSVRLPRPRLLETWLPQGWAFFTRDPREPRLLVYARGPQGWSPALLGPHSRPSNAFGFDRASRAQGVELAILLDAVQGSTWTRCAGDPPRCLEVLPARARLRNASPRPSACGTVGFALQEPVPWAWSRARPAVAMPSHVIRMEVSC